MVDVSLFSNMLVDEVSYTQLGNVGRFLLHCSFPGLDKVATSYFLREPPSSSHGTPLIVTESTIGGASG